MGYAYARGVEVCLMTTYRSIMVLGAISNFSNKVLKLEEGSKWARWLMLRGIKSTWLEFEGDELYRRHLTKGASQLSCMRKWIWRIILSSKSYCRRQFLKMKRYEMEGITWRKRTNPPLPSCNRLPVVCQSTQTSTARQLQGAELSSCTSYCFEPWRPFNSEE